MRENILVAEPTCHACPVACKKEVEITEGPYAGLRMESLEYEPAWALGANCGNYGVDSVAYMIDQCNDFGMDPIELGNVLSTYMEAGVAGFTNGDTPEWGEHPEMVALVPKIALREGVGDVLAEGAARTAVAFGCPDRSMTVKGQAIPAYDPRGLKGMGIAYATSNRGACHLRAYTPAAELGVMPFGSLKVDPLEWKGKGELTKVFQDVHAVSDSLDLCKFSAFAEGMDEYTQQFNAVTGLDYSTDETAGVRRAHLQPGALLQQPRRLPRRLRLSAGTLHQGTQHHARLDGPCMRAGPDARGVLRGARLGERRGAANPSCRNLAST